MKSTFMYNLGSTQQSHWPATSASKPLVFLLTSFLKLFSPASSFRRFLWWWPTRSRTPTPWLASLGRSSCSPDAQGCIERGCKEWHWNFNSQNKFFNGPSPPSLFFVYFRSFSNKHRIQGWDSSPRPLDCKSHPIITRPGLPPKQSK